MLAEIQQEGFTVRVWLDGKEQHNVIDCKVEFQAPGVPFVKLVLTYLVDDSLRIIAENAIVEQKESEVSAPMESP